MVNEDILTALKNSIEKGESLQTATNILINSGYNPRDVQEASRYIGEGIINQEPRENEQLTMPANKPLTYSGYVPRLPQNYPPRNYPQQNYPNQNYPQQYPQQIRPIQRANSNQQDIQKIKQEISSISPMQVQDSNSASYYPYTKKSDSLSNQLSKIGPRKSYTREIILLLILLILIGILISSVLFKERIVQFFSQLMA